MSDPSPLGQLPTRFPIFPLPNVVLFPGTYLPLHIFEPRYRAMTEAALAGDMVIGMVLLRSETDAMAERGPVFGVGCAGRIVEHRRLGDGRFNLLLYGERRFRIARELEVATPYREVEAELFAEPRLAELSPAARQALERVRPELEARMLATAIAFGVDSPVLEKQGLLEAADAVAQSELLLRLLSFRIAEARLPEGPKSLN
jgi:Lon protease-like protein